MRRAGYGAVGLIALVLVSLAVALGGDAPPKPVVDTGAATGVEIGDRAPAFALTNAVSGRQVSLASLRGRKTMLFFSEGINCQACMVQAADLERNAALAKAGIGLVSVTTDAPEDLAQAAREYGITAPLLADPTTAMSAAYGMLGLGGMGHPPTNGHAFLLLDVQGKVRWHRAYQEMYVKPGQLLRDMRKQVET